MENNLDGLIASEILKQRVPMVIVVEEREADYIITVASIKADDKWYHTSSAAGIRMKETSSFSVLRKSLSFGKEKPEIDRSGLET